jgi:hypothetical protein
MIHIWPGQPLYKITKLSTVIDSAPSILVSNIHVRDQITNISSKFYDPKLLLQIYQNL